MRLSIPLLRFRRTRLLGPLKKTKINLQLRYSIRDQRFDAHGTLHVEFTAFNLLVNFDLVWVLSSFPSTTTNVVEFFLQHSSQPVLLPGYVSH
jgi:hypothetical protein